MICILKANNKAGRVTLFYPQFNRTVTTAQTIITEAAAKKQPVPESYLIGNVMPEICRFYGIHPYVFD